MKYTVGDKVILGKGEKSISAKEKYAGRIATITRIKDGYSYPYLVDLDGGAFDWCDEELKPVNKIVITINGNEVLARLYEGDKVAKSTTAKCSPEDTFDFSVGAKLAFERLMGKYKSGDKVKVIKNTCCHLAKIGETITLTDELRGWHYENHGGFITESDIEPYVETEEENTPAFRVGDLVRIINTGKSFSTYSEWVKKNAPEFLNRYHNQKCALGDVGVIRAIAPHGVCNNRYGGICLIECPNNRVVLIGQDGIEKA